MAKKVKEETEDNSTVSSNDFMESLMKENKDDHFNGVESKNRVISTGSLLLDSLVKVRSGSVVRLTGKGAELGKTSECFVLAANFMKEMPKSKTLFIKAESRLGEEMKKRSGHTFVNTAAEWAYGTVFVLACNKFETVASMLEKLIKQMHDLGEHLCIIIDSLDGLILKDDYNKDVWGEANVKIAGVPLLTKLLFRRLGLPINHYDALLLITGQYSAEIKLDPYSKEPPRQGNSSGGSSVGHQCDYIFSYQPRYGGDNILENQDEKPDLNKNKIIGVYSTIEIQKSGTDVSGTRIKIPIRKGRVGSAIWVEKEVVDMVLSFGMAKRKGAWISFDEQWINKAKEKNIEVKAQIQGMNGLYEYFENNKPVLDFFHNEIKSLIC